MIRVVKHILRFLLPWACATCRTPLEGLEDEGFCPRCWLQIPHIQGLICQKCGAPLPYGGAHCYACQHHSPPCIVRSAVIYQEGIRRAIHRFKYGGRKSLGDKLAHLMVLTWDAYPELHGVDLILPVPLYLASYRQRGYNQADILARVLGRWLGIPVLSNALHKIRKTSSQFRLNREKRQVNLEQAFGLGAAQSDLQGKNLLIIDDVFTTGATLRACIEVLRPARPARIQAYTLARDY